MCLTLTMITSLQRKVGMNARPLIGNAVDFKPAAKLFRSFAHGVQAQMSCEIL